MGPDVTILFTAGIFLLVGTLFGYRIAEVDCERRKDEDTT